MRCILGSDPPRYLSIYSENFDYKKFINSMRERLEKNNNIYIVSVEANHNLHNPLEESYRNFASKNGNLKIIAGPIISVPETSKGKSQKGRVFDNAITKLASEGLISLYPSDVYFDDATSKLASEPSRNNLFYPLFERLSKEENLIFREENLVWSLCTPYFKEIPSGMGVSENADHDLNERITLFNKLTEGKEPLTERFDEKLLFLTYEEIGRSV